MASVYSSFNEKLGGSSASTFVGNKGDLFWDPESTTLRVSDGTTPGGVEVVGGGTIAAESQTGKSANIFIDNASIAVIDTDTINSIPEAQCYILTSSAITGDDKVVEIVKNASENYYLYTYDKPYDENFEYASQLIAKLTKEEAAICSLSPYFTTASGSVIEQAAQNYPFLMADRRELDKLRAAVAGYYLGQAYDNATVLTKQAYWETALSAAISGSIVSTWKVLNDMATAAASNGVNVNEAFLNDGYPTGAFYPAGGGVSNAYTRFLYYSNSVLNGNFTGYFNIGKINGAASGISGGHKHYLRFDSAVNWSQFTTDYTKVSLIGPSGTYTWNLSDAEKQTGAETYWIEMDSSAQVADEDAARVLTDEIMAGTYYSYDQNWTLRVENAPAASNEDDVVLELVMQNIGGHIIKYPRYGVANPPTANVYTRSFGF